jgi:hypothetical protein
MTQKTDKSKNRGRKPKQQESQVNQQEALTLETNYEVENHEKEKDINTTDNSYKDYANKTKNNNTMTNMFLTKTAQHIMNRFYELYGYAIKGDTCRRIVQIAQSYATRENINIQGDIQEIKITELYDNILNVLSLGYIPSPLDNTYNNILIRAIIDKYKVYP